MVFFFCAMPHRYKAGGGVMDKKECYRGIYNILPLEIRKRVQDFERLNEIRIRSGKPVVLHYDNCEFFLDNNKGVTHDRKCAYIVKEQDIKQLIDYICNYSRYAFSEQLRNGYLTIEGGHRIGVAGRVIVEEGRVKDLSNISFINIRIAHQIKGAGKKVIPYILNGEQIYNTLIISPPGCGKTTLLRDIIRILSDGEGIPKGYNVGVIDERSEIGACYKGVPQNDLGCRADVLDGCPKAEGMMMLLRSMSPKVIAVDEIGSGKDAEAIEYIMKSGTNVIATVHGLDMGEIRDKQVFNRLVREGAFKRYIVLEGGMVGRVSRIFDERGSILYIRTQREQECLKRESHIVKGKNVVMTA